MRLGGARYGGNATVPAYANDQPRPSQKPTRMQGGGVWVEHLRWAAPESFALFSKAFTCMLHVPIWLGAPRAGWLEADWAPGFFRRYLGNVPPSVNHRIRPTAAQVRCSFAHVHRPQPLDVGAHHAIAATPVAR